MIPVTYTSEYPTRNISYACPGALVVLRPDSRGKVGIFSWGEFLGTPGKKFVGGRELAVFGQRTPEGVLSLEIRSEGNPRQPPYYGHIFRCTSILAHQSGESARFQTFEEALAWAQKVILEAQEWIKARHLQEKEITLGREVFVLVTPPGRGGWDLHRRHDPEPFASLDADGAFTLHVHRLPYSLLPIADEILEAVEAALGGQDAKVG